MQTTATATAPAAARPPGAVHRPDQDERSFGLLRVGGAMLAVPVAVLSEVIPCPPQLDPLPLPLPALLGALSLRGTVIPVLDLNTALGLTAQALPPAAGQVVVVVVIESPGAESTAERSAARRVLGLRADAVCGMARLPASRLTALAAGAAASALPAPAATHSFEHEAGIVTLIDVAAIAAAPGVPTGCEAAASHAGAALGPPPEPLLLFRCGALPLGVATASVDATVPRTAVNASTLCTELCLGVIEHHGQDVPIVDTLRLLGLGTGTNIKADVPGATGTAALVLRLPAGRIALTIDEVIDIVRPARSALLAVPAMALDEAPLFAGVLAGADGTQHLLLDAQAFADHPLLTALAGMARAARPPAGTGQAAKAATAQTDATAAMATTTTANAASAYLTFDAGFEAASPLLHVSEILPYPPHATRLASRHAAVLGSFVHRGSAVPLICLSTLLGQAAPDELDTTRVLLVRRPVSAGAAEADVGFVVRSLRSIENARWEHAGVRRTALIEVGHGPQQRTLPRVDLQQIAIRGD